MAKSTHGLIIVGKRGMQASVDRHETRADNRNNRTQWHFQVPTSNVCQVCPDSYRLLAYHGGNMLRLSQMMLLFLLNQVRISSKFCLAALLATVLCWASSVFLASSKLTLLLFGNKSALGMCSTSSKPAKLRLFSSFVSERSVLDCASCGMSVGPEDVMLGLVLVEISLQNFGRCLPITQPYKQCTGKVSS